MELLALKDKGKDLGLDISDKMLEQFDKYAKLLIEWNSFMNLTAIDKYEDIIEKHFYDSIICASFCASDIRIADVGSGAGFPGLPLKIVRPDLSLVIVEPLNKRCKFLAKVVEELGLDNVIIENKRSEDYVKEARESFDVVTARAVANLSMLSELCIPLVKKDGIFLAMKGMEGYNEEDKAMNALNKLGVKRIAVKEANLSDGSLRINLIYQKVKNTPVAYPRNFAKIKKNPL